MKVVSRQPIFSPECDTDENMNGLIHQRFSKKLTFDTKLIINDATVVMDKLNNRPRKCLGINTINEVYHSYSIT